MDQAFSWIVTILGLLGFWLAGQKIWWAWYINILNQVMWVIFALLTDYYAFLVGTAAYFFVFCRNAYRWTREHFNKDLQESVELVVRDYEDQWTAHNLQVCGNVSDKYHYACVKVNGHPGDHGYAGMFWGPLEGTWGLVPKRPIHNPPGDCVFTTVENPDGSSSAKCIIEHIHVNRQP